MSKRKELFGSGCIFSVYLRRMAKDRDEIRKNIDLPHSSLEILAWLANNERMAVKNFMEGVLIKMAKSKERAFKKYKQTA